MVADLGVEPSSRVYETRALPFRLSTFSKYSRNPDLSSDSLSFGDMDRTKVVVNPTPGASDDSRRQILPQEFVAIGATVLAVGFNTPILIHHPRPGSDAATAAGMLRDRLFAARECCVYRYPARRFVSQALRVHLGIALRHPAFLIPALEQ